MDCPDGGKTRTIVKSLLVRQFLNIDPPISIYKLVNFCGKEVSSDMHVCSIILDLLSHVRVCVIYPPFNDRSVKIAGEITYLMKQNKTCE